MHDSPNLISKRYTSSNSTQDFIRNAIFAFLILGTVGWYGFGALTAKENSSVSGVFGDDISEKIGGDIEVHPDPVEIVVPKKVTTSTLDTGLFSAHAILAKDAETGEALFYKHEDSVRSIASITKLMSALVLLDRGLDMNGTTTAVEGQIFDNHLQPGAT